MVQLLSIEGALQTDDVAAEYLPYIDALSEETLRQFYRDMVITRRFDLEATNLQRQGQLALWPPSHGQEAAQVGSARAARPQDHLFPSYREHSIGMIRGVDVVDIVRVMRGVTNGGWDPAECGNFHLYTLVLGSQVLHATGYAMGITLDGQAGTGDPETDQAVMAYFGDGATSQGDVQNNQWAISVPVRVQSKVPLYLRAGGFGMPGIQVDGNDVLASYAVTRKNLDEARSGQGPRLIEALTYRIGAHTTSDDPTKYRMDAETASWVAKDPIVRYASYLRARGEGDDFFAAAASEAEDFSADLRHRTLALEVPSTDLIFDHVYSEQHPVMDAQKQWLADYEASLGGSIR
jgi:2-oxoisovalerate dehydrogenase E1 component alpha subunit